MSDRPCPPLPAVADLCELVVKVAEEAMGLRDTAPVITKKLDGSYVTSVDQDLQKRLMDALVIRWPDFGVIGEEMSHADQVSIARTCAQGYWVLDPLDGTTNFTSGFPCYGISVALVIERRLQLGVVYDPVRKECFSAQVGQGAWLNGVAIRCRGPLTLDDCIANVDYKRLVGELAVRLVQSPPYRSQRNIGASVLEWCWLAAGRIQLYLHGGQRLWDYAAGYLILTEAGGAATTLTGVPLDGGSLQKRSVVAASSQELLAEWSAWIQLNRFDAPAPSRPPGDLL